jgi:hypothetical protein
VLGVLEQYQGWSNTCFSPQFAEKALWSIRSRRLVTLLVDFSTFQGTVEMRIIHESYISVDCPTCNAVLAIELKDIDIDDTGCVVPYSCKCMSCGERIALKKQLIPHKWLAKVDLM